MLSGSFQLEFYYKRIHKKENEDQKILMLNLNKWKKIKNENILKLKKIYEDKENLFLIIENSKGNIYEILQFYDYISENLIANFLEKILKIILQLKSQEFDLKIIIPNQI